MHALVVCCPGVSPVRPSARLVLLPPLLLCCLTSEIHGRSQDGRHEVLVVLDVLEQVLRGVHGHTLEGAHEVLTSGVAAGHLLPQLLRRSESRLRSNRRRLLRDNQRQSAAHKRQDQHGAHGEAAGSGGEREEQRGGGGRR